jgi:site-specific recombinase XerD
LIAREPQAAAWFADLLRRGLAGNTVVAYARALSEYLERCHRQGVDPLTVTRADVAGYVRELTSRPSGRTFQANPAKTLAANTGCFDDKSRCSPKARAACEQTLMTGHP